MPDNHFFLDKRQSDGRLPGTVYELIKACASGLLMEGPDTKVAAASDLFMQLKAQGTYVIFVIKFSAYWL